MQGNNTLRLNKATLMAAIAYWLNTSIIKGPDLVAVTNVSEASDRDCTVFDVEIRDVKPEEAKPDGR